MLKNQIFLDYEKTYLLRACSFCVFCFAKLDHMIGDIQNSQLMGNSNNRCIFT